VLHRDQSLMPRRRRCWASWVYTSDGDFLHPKIAVTYWMNSLQGIDERYPLFVSLNPKRAIPDALIFDQTEFDHPVFDPAGPGRPGTHRRPAGPAGHLVRGRPSGPRLPRRWVVERRQGGARPGLGHPLGNRHGPRRTATKSKADCVTAGLWRRHQHTDG